MHTIMHKVPLHYVSHMEVGATAWTTVLVVNPGYSAGKEHWARRMYVVKLRDAIHSDGCMNACMRA